MSEQIEQGNGKVVFWLITVALLVAATLVVWQFIPALLWASVLSVLLYPWYKKKLKGFEKRKHPETLASLYVTLFTAFVMLSAVLAFFVIGGVEIYNFASDLVADTSSGQITLDNLAHEADVYIVPWAERFGAPDFTVSGYLEKHREEIASNVYGPITEAVKKLVMTIVTLVIAFLTTFFMLRDSHRLLEPVCDLIPLPRDRTTAILKRMAATIRSVFYSVVAVALIQGFICFLAYLALGVPSPVAWWAITTVLAMIPLLGAPVGYVPAALLLILTGHPVQGVILLVVGFGLVSNLDNFLRPIFIAMGSNLHMMAIFFSLLGGVLTMGPIGLMAGPILLTLVLGMLDVLRERRRIAEGLPPVPEFGEA